MYPVPSQCSWCVRAICSASCSSGCRLPDRIRAPDQRVRLHHAEFVLRQPIELEQDAVGHGELAQIVQRGRAQEQVGGLGGQPELRGEPRRPDMTHALRVLPGRVVAELGGERQAAPEFRSAPPPARYVRWRTFSSSRSFCRWSARWRKRASSRLPMRSRTSGTRRTASPGSPWPRPIAPAVGRDAVVTGDDEYGQVAALRDVRAAATRARRIRR